MQNRAMPDARARDGASATFGQTGCIAGRKRGLSGLSHISFPCRIAQLRSSSRTTQSAGTRRLRRLPWTGANPR